MHVNFDDVRHSSHLRPYRLLFSFSFSFVFFLFSVFSVEIQMRNRKIHDVFLCLKANAGLGFTKTTEQSITKLWYLYQH